MAHARRPLTLREACAVILLKTSYSKYSVINEVKERCAGIVYVQDAQGNSELQLLMERQDVNLGDYDGGFLDEENKHACEQSPEISEPESEAQEPKTGACTPTAGAEDQTNPEAISTHSRMEEEGTTTLVMEDSYTDFFRVSIGPTSRLITESLEARFDLAISTLGCSAVTIKMMTTEKRKLSGNMRLLSGISIFKISN